MRVILISLIFFTGCVTKKNITTEKQVKDSIVYINRIDTIRDTKTIFKGFDTQIDFKCDSTALNQSYKSGDVQYKVIKEKGQIRFIIKKDSSFISEKYKSKLKDSILSVLDKSERTKTIVKTNEFWKIPFFILLVFWVLGITPKFIFGFIRKLIVGL